MTKVTIKSHYNSSNDGTFNFEVEDDEVLSFVRMAADLNSDQLAELHAGWHLDDLESNPMAEDKVYLTAKGKERVQNGG